jgi:predicted AlkP superfamily phosphohydrolase/phosphomutase
VRRRASAWLALLLVLTSSAAARDGAARRMIVLGVDGLDPVLLGRLMEQGVTPNLRRLAGLGGFRPLGTSIPPQSPVAWSNFITGMDPGGHGLFDFIALDRKTLAPYLSSARVEPAERKPIALGRWRIPLGREKTVRLRDGQAFWEVLDREGVSARLFQVPANYPPVPVGDAALSGMGTPDLRGTPGTFSYYTNDPTVRPGPVSGGVIRRVALSNGEMTSVLEGPPNSFLAEAPWSTVAVRVRTDVSNPVALVQVGEEQRLMGVGEWSDWIGVRFPLLPGLVEVPGMVRVYLQRTSPRFGLYISPVNIDPRDPAQPISHPGEYARELAEAAGPFYTEEMPEDTKALSAHVLGPQEFLRQTSLVMDERRRLFRYELERLSRQSGDQFLFFYLSTVDQRNHMMAREMDPEHPFHRADTPRELAEAMRETYREVDEMAGWVLDRLQPDTTFIVMSDHGFAPFRRGANLNTWLEQQGYLSLIDPARRDSYEWLEGINWSRTRAFAIGLNSLYLNVRGRERSGIVAPEEREALARQIASRLAQWQDPQTGALVVTQPLVREEVYRGVHVEAAPDVIVGYGNGYRASWDTTTGKIPAALIEDNDHEWSGDHCMDARLVPGVLLANRPLTAGEADLRDLPVTILDHFGIARPPQMSGRSVL